jgi:hypothetical protein
LLAGPAAGDATAAGPALSVPAAGFCVPAPDDGSSVPRALGALGIGAPGTAPLAVLDTGVDPAVPQLAGRVLPGVDAATGAPLAGDFDGHGTEAAGIAASGGAGVLGVAPATPVLPVRIFDLTRTATAQTLARGIDQAVRRGARVAVIEGSGPLDAVTLEDRELLARAIGNAWAAGTLVVAPSGDEGTDVATVAGALPHVLTVGAASPQGTRSGQSNSGPWVDVVAPGEAVTGPLPGGVCNLGFGFGTGTTFAAPAVAAGAAVVLARRPGLTMQQDFELLRRAAADLGTAGRDPDTGYGLFSLQAALTAKAPGKETQREVDDDPYWVRGRFAKTHPALLTKSKMRFKAFGSVNPSEDPADVYPIRLIKGERVVVSVTAADPNALLELSILRPTAGDFDVTEEVVDETVAVATGGYSSDPQVELRASATGLYYVAVGASDPVDEDDPTATPPDTEPYTISAYKQRKKAKPKHTAKKKAHR